ncbi:MAG: PaaI family thioesterase [Acidobacteriota bacterium]
MTRPAFEPQFAGYRERLIESFHSQQVMHTLGATLGDVRPGGVAIEFPFRPDWSQQHGFVHAGIIATVLDSACGYAAFSLMPENAAVLTVEFKINLLSPAAGDTFRAVGTVVKPGRTITVTEGEMFAVTGSEEKLIASMVGTIMSVFDRPGVEG